MTKNGMKKRDALQSTVNMAMLNSGMERIFTQEGILWTNETPWR